MTGTQQDKKVIYDDLLKEKQLKYLVLGYVFDQWDEMKWVSVGCTTEEARDRNVKGLVGAKVYELKEIV